MGNPFANPKLEGRNGEIWKLYVQGWTQEAIAEKYNLTQGRIAQIIAAVRATIPETDRAHLIQRELELLDTARVMALELALSPLPPAFDKDGNALRDPESKAIVRDATGRVQAVKLALETQRDMRKLLGLDQPLKVDATVTDAAAIKAAELAAEAAARMNGEDE